MKSLFTVILFLFSGYSASWRHAPDAYAERPFDATIVPGCPSDPDGSVSECQWRRAVWAAALYHGGSTRKIVASGDAVYTPFVEAEGIAAALVALGVPEEDVALETRARHTDENASFAAEVAGERGWTRIAVASIGAHAVLMDRMLGRWGVEVTALPMDRGLVRAADATRPKGLRTRKVEAWRAPEERDDDAQPARFPKYLSRAFAPRDAVLPPPLPR